MEDYYDRTRNTRLNVFNKLYAELKRYQSIKDKITPIEIEEIKHNLKKYILFPRCDSIERNEVPDEKFDDVNKIYIAHLFAEASIDVVGQVKDAVKIILTSPFETFFKISYLRHMFTSKENPSSSEELFKMGIDSLDDKKLEYFTDNGIMYAFGFISEDECINPDDAYIFKENTRECCYFSSIRLDIGNEHFDGLALYQPASIIANYLEQKGIETLSLPIQTNFQDKPAEYYLRIKFFIEHYKFEDDEEVIGLLVSVTSMSFYPHRMTPFMELFIDSGLVDNGGCFRYDEENIIKWWNEFQPLIHIAEDLIKKFNIVNFEFNWFELFRTLEEYKKNLNNGTSFQRTAYQLKHRIRYGSPEYNSVYPSDKTEEDIENENNRNIQSTINFLRKHGRNPEMDSYRGIANLLYDVTPKDVPMEVLDIIGSYASFECGEEAIPLDPHDFKYYDNDDET